MAKIKIKKLDFNKINLMDLIKFIPSAIFSIILLACTYCIGLILYLGLFGDFNLLGALVLDSVFSIILLCFLLIFCKEANEKNYEREEITLGFFSLIMAFLTGHFLILTLLYISFFIMLSSFFVDLYLWFRIFCFGLSLSILSATVYAYKTVFNEIKTDISKNKGNVIEQKFWRAVWKNEN